MKGSYPATTTYYRKGNTFNLLKMSYARVLLAFGSHTQPSLMPVYLAPCLSLSQHQPLYQLLSKTPRKLSQRRYQPADCLPRSGLHSPRSSSLFPASSSQSSSPVASEPRSCLSRDGGGLKKKSVVFADTVGLALTDVRLFVSEPSPLSSGPGTTPHLDDNQGQNDKVCLETDGSNGHQEEAYRGYTRLSQYRPLHTTLGIQNSSDPQSLRRGLSRVREWRAKGLAKQLNETTPSTEL
ncbi:hypothetical protein JOQ06_008157 [Pogonophryne albipinna]|uniref:Uncharacterized protein n=1 Tax=Pogonophryne albipinna TaxID=1090488 RepID=A0AAD6AJQ7_9TELE|nr:hypothetical protein JOQ06_008157 [Pogonophryne albipinna]